MSIKRFVAMFAFCASVFSVLPVQPAAAQDGYKYKILDVGVDQGFFYIMLDRNIPESHCSTNPNRAAIALSADNFEATQAVLLAAFLSGRRLGFVLAHSEDCIGNGALRIKYARTVE